MGKIFELRPREAIEPIREYEDERGGKVLLFYTLVAVFSVWGVIAWIGYRAWNG